MNPLARGALPICLLLVTSASVLRAQPACDSDTWFDLDNTDAQCSIVGDDNFVDVSVPFVPGYFEGDAGERRMQTLIENRGKFALRISPLSEDLAAITLEVLDPGDVLVTRRNLVTSLDLADTRATSQRKDLIVPANTLFCGDELVGGAVIVPLHMKDSDGNPQAISSCGPKQRSEASRPWDWNIHLAPADDDDSDDAGAAGDFNIEKTWGYGFKIDPQARAWKSNVWRFELAGSGVTNDSDFHDAVKADFSWARNKNFLASSGTKKPFKATWLGAYLRPETNFDDDHRDYVYGLRAEAILSARALFGTSFGRGVRPYVSLAVELVDPDKREDGTAPGNYERLAGDLHWKFFPQKSVMVELDWKAKYILKSEDLTVLGLDDHLQDRLDLTVVLKVSESDQFQPFIKLTRGEGSPTFEFAEEILVGFAWNHLFKGEKPLFPSG